jgi:hypothetical protein
MIPTCIPDDSSQQIKYLVYAMTAIDVISVVASVGMWIWGCFSRKEVYPDQTESI